MLWRASTILIFFCFHLTCSLKYEAIKLCTHWAFPIMDVPVYTLCVCVCAVCIYYNRHAHIKWNCCCVIRRRKGALKRQQLRAHIYIYNYSMENCMRILYSLCVQRPAITNSFCNIIFNSLIRLSRQWRWWWWVVCAAAWMRHSTRAFVQSNVCNATKRVVMTRGLTLLPLFFNFLWYDFFFRCYNLHYRSVDTYNKYI